MLPGPLRLPPPRLAPRQLLPSLSLILSPW